MNATTSVPPSKLAARLATLQALAQGASSPEQFFAGWLEHVLALCGATGGRLRRPSADGLLAPVATRRFEAAATPQEGASRYERLVFESFTTGRPKAVPPREQLPAEEADANSTSASLLLAPLEIDGEL